MKYLANDGRTAEVISPMADTCGRIKVVIDGNDKPVLVRYDDFIHEFNAIAKDDSNSFKTS